MTNYPRRESLLDRITRLERTIGLLENLRVSGRGDDTATLLLGTTGGVTVYKRSGVGTYRISVTAPAGGIGAGVAYANVPVGYRPPANMSGLVVWNQTAGTIIPAEARQNGDLWLLAAAAAGDVVRGIVTVPLQ